MEIPSLLLASGTGAPAHAAGVPFLFALLGQAPVPAVVGNWMIVLALFCSIIFGFAIVVDRYRRKPPAEATFATKTEVAEIRADSRRDLTALRGEMASTDGKIFTAIENLRLEVKRDVHGLDVASEKRSSKIHERIDTLAAAYASHQGAVTAKLDNLPCSKTGRCPS